ncbi:tRNA (adenosine(37)-N6)-threonylcarbamoyltransferase complex ATPase subunit type 1 TsaE [Candidatus Kaiserbacteria bacterium RIFCSPHIGHO2_02_FULL_50_50]|uniref:tRNA threonylcarbamoyladenosine biosynthesis protein TsaE n=1 Tax=Candidatus Kaiserbacteria bacterium RIFCSPHIGHO2_02_FULL_50_50 TaxID=1798492 RepID=A0A1F6DF29_9BACT|nr:MAG: tRNA (adenosine(37)-N6)-threonylcarbamoyltransferase complex ATPase subunit type 1 TsaE [Candidatus Kaiserbacteria bacterium RIFCSPHIGHO2_02_FULL_50_50]OGG88682.1 MAG: tRNA (adenosine(37)-N6)-threonylcarbamoyltransferase complex ATPase subunit type 1 TsaE [Candidatus Kaiserbacteria bacterium RIFCSPLOWO2_12_FULL_50_10]
MIYHTQRAEDWRDVAKKIIAALPERQGATVLRMQGTLGAGKTTCTQAIAQELGVQEHVTSPTFVLMQLYEATHPRFNRLVHIDAYRLEDSEEAAVLRLPEYFADPRTFMVVEWPENLEGLLPEDAITVKIDIVHEGRSITIA